MFETAYRLRQFRIDRTIVRFRRCPAARRSSDRRWRGNTSDLNGRIVTRDVLGTTVTSGRAAWRFQAVSVDYYGPLFSEDAQIAEERKVPKSALFAARCGFEQFAAFGLEAGPPAKFVGISQSSLAAFFRSLKTPARAVLQWKPPETGYVVLQHHSEWAHRVGSHARHNGAHESPRCTAWCPIVVPC